MEFINGSISCEKNDKGLYIYKSNPSNTFKLKTKDLPRYKIITEFENEFINDYKENIERSVKQIEEKLNSNKKK